MNLELSLRSSLDTAPLRDAFLKSKRIHIPNFFSGASAERLWQAVKFETPWNLIFNEGNTTFTLSPDDIRTLSFEKIQDIRKSVLAQAQTGFQFIYNNFNIYEDFEKGANKDHFLMNFQRFINSEPFLNFISGVTGFNDLRFANSQATAFGPGHFLTKHSDEVGRANRKLAYVVSLTKKWDLDWGGVLLFINQDGKVVEGFIPTFNALNLFSVPQNHTVSYIVPFAPEIRYSLTGWIS